MPTTITNPQRFTAKESSVKVRITPVRRRTLRREQRALAKRTPPTDENIDSLVCNICYEETLGTEDAPRDTSLMCSSGHAVCFACIRKLMEPKMRKCSASCCSMAYTCPYCRQEGCIGTINLAALAANSHRASYAKFCCGGCLERWSELAYDSDADSESESE